MIRHSLAQSDWPPGDRQLWQNAQLKGDVIEPDGLAARWRPATRHQVAKGYALWLGFLDSSKALDNDSGPAERVTPEALRAYIVWLKQRELSSTTVASRITDLHEAIRVMGPDANLTLLRDTRDRLRQRQEPRRGKHVRVIAASELVRLATQYLTTLPQVPSQTERMRASWFRDGVMMLLIASRPIRLRNLAGIEIGRHLLAQGQQYKLLFTADETKEHLQFVIDCPSEFTPWLQQYLNYWRPLLLRGKPTPSLWLSMRGGPLSAQAIYIAICKLTRQLTGRSINPHLFRDCLTSETAERMPELLPATSRILGHASLSMTNKHYNQAQMLSAIRALQDTLRKVLEEPKS
jgi:site-specific recombinase XerD